MPKMELLHPMYDAARPPHRFPTGAVIDVDEETAIRWMDRNVAVPGKKDDPTYREQRRAELAAQLAALQAEEQDDDPPIMTLSNDQPRRRGRPAKGARTAQGKAPTRPAPVMSGLAAPNVGQGEAEG